MAVAECNEKVPTVPTFFRKYTNEFNAMLESAVLARNMIKG